MLLIGAALLLTTHLGVSGQTGGETNQTVRQARGSLTAVKENFCAEVQPPVCKTLQKALDALDETKITGQTAYSLNDVPVGLADTVALLSKAGGANPSVKKALGDVQEAQNQMFEEYVNKALGELRSPCLASASVNTVPAQAELKSALLAWNGAEPSPITSAASSSVEQVIATATRFIALAEDLSGKTKSKQAVSDKVRTHLEAAKEHFAQATKTVEDAGKKNETMGDGGAAASTGSASRVGAFPILGVVSVCVSALPVLFLAWLAWGGVLTRKVPSTELKALKGAANEAAQRYRTLLDQNLAYQQEIYRLASENETLRRQLFPKPGPVEGRPAVKNRRDPHEDLEETDGVEGGPAIQKDGSGYPSFKVEIGPVRVSQVADQAPQPVPSESAYALDDPLTDYQRARSTGDTNEEAQFKRKYGPCYTLSCTNLAQRGIAGARLTFQQDPRASFLAVTVPDGRTLLFPQFSKELAFTPGMMEGVFSYPEGAISELRLTQAAEVKTAGEGWVLERPGQFEHA